MKNIIVYDDLTSTWTLKEDSTKLKCNHDYAYLDRYDDDILICDDCDSNFDEYEENEIAINILISRAEQQHSYY